MVDLLTINKAQKEELKWKRENTWKDVYNNEKFASVQTENQFSSKRVEYKEAPKAAEKPPAGI